ncbi:MAG: response regulator [Vicinamibacteria bacterium]
MKRLCSDRLPFRHQLALVVTLTSALAVGLAALGTLGYEAKLAYGDLEDDFLPLARIIGANSIGALAFDDVHAARETLGVLAIKPDVVSARLYTAAGRPFATYRRSGADADGLPADPGPPGHRFAGGYLLVFEPISHDAERIGTLYMKIDTGEKVARLIRTLGVLALGFLAATVAALLFSTRLQRRVSQPVLELATAARKVSQSRDYSIRAEPSGPDDLRALTLGFNEMLAQIEERDGALRAARDELEERVAERVRDLQREVVERRKAEAESELRAQLLHLQGAALESTADAVVITDREKVIQWVNPSFCALVGYATEEVTGRRVSMFGSGRPEDLAAYREMTALAGAGQVWAGELMGKRKDGALRLVAQTVTPVRGDDGRISHYVAVLRDVSQRRRLEEQLRQAQKMEAVGRLSGGVAHDFNNILNVILGFGEMLLKKLPADDGLRRYGVEILKAANRGASLTRQLLAFSRQQVLQPKVIDLNAAVSEMERMLSRLIGEDVELVTSLEPRLGRVEVDPGQVEQVLMNLAVNARDAMPNGGTLTIETANVDLTEADTRQYEYPVSPGPYVRITVGDSGSGMDALTLSHIFEPFFTTKPVDKGTGLGLATVYGIVKQSKGYIWASSEAGVGTTFTIVLPRMPGEAAPPAEAEQDGAGVAGRGTVLLVEDDEAARGLWQEMLEMLGYRTVVAANGVEALEQAEAQRGRIDLLLTDVVMPRLGGRELVARLREKRPDVRVIFMSGYTADTILRQGIADSGSPFLQKPFSAQQLASKIAETLEGAGRTLLVAKTPGSLAGA